jgi:hypothetical protein
VEVEVRAKVQQSQVQIKEIAGKIFVGEDAELEVPLPLRTLI